MWTSAPVHPPSSERAAALRGMKAVGELLPRAVCAGSGSAAVPSGTPGAAQGSVASAAISRHGSGWMELGDPSVHTQHTHSSYPAASLEPALLPSPAVDTAVRGTAHICAFPVYHSFGLQSLLMAPNEIKAALAGGCAHTVRHS